ncbi:uncharacterized protein DNG_08091 [Cephalotrichum gorgonifer]|uniref:Transcription factor domain-containing protein n=1 Tax=Cephalotrichum gorgonifer TaxID=2041049 RepID=A0AAE8N4H5_9PEZI|nr:uncharacterized protein DNG_08091 [Cephalotrichum gorgonifer]
MERPSERSEDLADRRIPESSINVIEPEPITHSADATDGIDSTDGVGSIMFTKGERVDAGFFGPSSNISFTREILGATILEFYNASISLYMIMGRVLDVLYGSNLDSDTPPDMFKIAIDVSLMENQISEAQKSFPSTLYPVQLSDLMGGTRPPVRTLRFRLILTLRYHNLRILAHRPLLQRYLGILRSHPSEHKQSLSSLHQVGVSSLHICMQSARTIIELLAYTTKSKGEDKGLLGAWWFSLYYVFNAALVIYSGLLIQSYTEDHGWPFSLSNSEIQRNLLYQAVDSLMSLDNGNTRAEKCAQYILRLDRVLDSLYTQNRPRTDTIPALMDTLQHEGSRLNGGALNTDSYHIEQTPFELDFSELMVPGDLDFLKPALQDVEMSGLEVDLMSRDAIVSTFPAEIYTGPIALQADVAIYLTFLLVLAHMPRLLNLQGQHRQRRLASQR